MSGLLSVATCYIHRTNLNYEVNLQGRGACDLSFTEPFISLSYTPVYGLPLHELIFNNFPEEVDLMA